jgi:hypothetical protein
MQRKAGRPSQQAEVVEWLEAFIGKSPMGKASRMVLKAGNERGYCRASIFKAKQALGIKALHTAKFDGGRWVWVSARAAYAWRRRPDSQ